MTTWQPFAVAMFMSLIFMALLKMWNSLPLFHKSTSPVPLQIVPPRLMLASTFWTNAVSLYFLQFWLVYQDTKTMNDGMLAALVMSGAFNFYYIIITLATTFTLPANFKETAAPKLGAVASFTVCGALLGMWL